MDIEEINNKVKEVYGLGGLTENDKLWASGLMSVYDNESKNDEPKGSKRYDVHWLPFRFRSTIPVRN